VENKIQSLKSHSSFLKNTLPLMNNDVGRKDQTLIVQNSITLTPICGRMTMVGILKKIITPYPKSVEFVLE
jgi:hypothetical protein